MTQHGERFHFALGVPGDRSKHCSPVTVAGFVFWPFNPIRGRRMDNVTLIRVVSGVLAVVVLAILLYRTKKKAPR
jgi:hypothetical protein